MDDETETAETPKTAETVEAPARLRSLAFDLLRAPDMATTEDVRRLAQLVLIRDAAIRAVVEQSDVSLIQLNVFYTETEQEHTFGSLMAAPHLSDQRVQELSDSPLFQVPLHELYQLILQAHAEREGLRRRSIRETLELLEELFRAPDTTLEQAHALVANMCEQARKELDKP